MNGFVNRVTCIPSGRVVEVPGGTSLLAAIRKAGLPIGSSCDGDGICGRCGVQLVAGAGALTPETAEEVRIKDANRVPPEDRLACRARVGGDVVVTARYWGRLPEAP
jgi:2Fe-2S ferredoxin